MRFWTAGLALMLAVAFGRTADAATKDCAAPLEGPGRPIAISGPLSEPERIDLSTLVFRMLAKPMRGERPEILAAHAPACPLGVFAIRGGKLALSAGASPLPQRWATEDGKVVFYLAGGEADPIARKLGVTTRPYMLVAVDDRLRFALKLYDGAPSDDAIKAAIVDIVEGPNFRPFAAYDAESGAVSLSLKTKSGVTAQLFGPPPAGQPSAVILSADGHYFTAAESGAMVMREAGVACPQKLQGLSRTRLIVVLETAKALDLGCQYSGAGATVTIFVERAPGLTLGKAFQAQKSKAMNKRGVQATALLVALKGVTNFEYGASWLDENNLGGGVWVGRRGDFIVEVRATWELASFRRAGDAILLVDRTLLSSPTPAAD